MSFLMMGRDMRAMVERALVLGRHVLGVIAGYGRVPGECVDGPRG